jgi:hypothetical protein
MIALHLAVWGICGSEISGSRSIHLLVGAKVRAPGAFGSLNEALYNGLSILSCGEGTLSEVFISYARHDREFVARLYQDLKEHDVDVFFDQVIQPGPSWVKTLTEAIESARYILVVLSPEYLTSPWAEQEVNVALLRESEKKATVIPLMARRCKPPGLLGKKTYADFTKTYDSGFAELLTVLQRTDPQREVRDTPGHFHGEIDEKDAKKLAVTVARFTSAPRSGHGGPSKKPKHAPGSAKRCFIVMPFGHADLESIYDDILKPMVKVCKLKCQRGDDLFGSNIVMDDIRDSIERADIVIADLTRQSANVFYEVGIAHTIGRPVLLIAQSTEDVPFDLRHHRVLLYENSMSGGKKFEKKLKKNLLAMLKDVPKTRERP